MRGMVIDLDDKQIMTLAVSLSGAEAMDLKEAAAKRYAYRMQHMACRYQFGKAAGVTEIPVIMVAGE